MHNSSIDNLLSLSTELSLLLIIIVGARIGEVERDGENKEASVFVC